MGQRTISGRVPLKLAETLAEAIQAPEHAGYAVLRRGEGGNEMTGAWDMRRTVYVVTVEPTMDAPETH